MKVVYLIKYRIDENESIKVHSVKSVPDKIVSGKGFSDYEQKLISSSGCSKSELLPINSGYTLNKIWVFDVDIMVTSIPALGVPFKQSIRNHQINKLLTQ